MVEGGKCI